MAGQGTGLEFEEIHFTRIPSQTNIYGLAKIERASEPNKVFITSLSGKVVCLEYPGNSLVPSAREVPFTYIPGGSVVFILYAL